MDQSYYTFVPLPDHPELHYCYRGDFECGNLNSLQVPEKEVFQKEQGQTHKRNCQKRKCKFYSKRLFTLSVSFYLKQPF